MISYDFGFFLTIFFGIITIIGIFISLFVIYRPKLKYYQIDPRKLFSNKVDELSRFKIQYKNKKTDGKLVFLQALIINEGNCDIDSNSIYEPLSIAYNSPYKLLDAFIDDKYKNIFLELDNDKIFIKWDLLKKKEFFIINIILQCENDEDDYNFSEWNLRNKFTNITARIKNIYKIKKESYNKIISNREKVKIIVNTSIMIVFLLALIFSSIHINQIRQAMDKTNYQIQDIANTSLEVNHIYLNMIFRYENIINNILNEGINISGVNDELENIAILRKEALNRYIINNQDENGNENEYVTVEYIDSRILLLIFITIIIFMFNIYFIISYIKTSIISKYLK